jgi:Tfp pilus assembly protein PilF
MTHVIAINSKHANAYACRGLAYVEKKEWDKAIADFTESIRIDPKNYTAYAGRGLAFRGKREWDKAHRDLQNAEELKANR